MGPRGDQWTEQTAPPPTHTQWEDKGEVNQKRRASGVRSEVVSKVLALPTEDQSSVPRTHIQKARCDGVLEISALEKQTRGLLSRQHRLLGEF